MLTHERLKELVFYCFERKALVWKCDRGLNKVAGRCIGSVNGRGRVCASVDNKTYVVSRLVWFYHHGVWPLKTIDHIDRDPLNNAIENLREASMEEQNFNRGVRKNRNLPKWVSEVWKNGKVRYAARVTIKRKTYHLGKFATVKEAHDVAMAFAKKHQGKFFVEA